MIHAEKKCRKIKSGRISFSPEAAKWLRQSQVYKSLLWRIRGGKSNTGNLQRSALWVGILNPFGLNEREVLICIRVCSKKLDFFRATGKEYRRKHLRKRLKRAQDKEKDDAERQILAIIKREKEQSFWRRIKYAMKKTSGGSVQVVQVEGEEGEIREYHTKEEIHEAIWSNIHQK